MCPSFIKFAEKFDTLEEMWDACEDSDWMVWLAYKLQIPVKTLVLAKGLCANTARHLMQDTRSIDAVDAAIAFGRGKATKKELAAAHRAAKKAAEDAAMKGVAIRDAAANAAADAADAAPVTRDNHITAHIAATADTAYAIHAAGYTAADSAKVQNQKQTADICHKILTRSVLARLRNFQKSSAAKEKYYIGAIVEYFGSYETTCLFLYSGPENKILKIEHEIALKWRRGKWDEQMGKSGFDENQHTPVDGREIPEKDFRVLKKYLNIIYENGKHV